MNKKVVIDELTHYNKWRRGFNDEPPNPTDIGKVIDRAIELLKKDEI